jgi:ribose transport system ATP-binding protein
MRAVTPVLEIRHLSKTFGGEHALLDVDLVIEPGEVHGLLGENGSGKSTLIKILSGYYAPEVGAEIRVSGQSVRLPLAPGGFRRLGMSFVHQDLGLIDAISVLENLWIGELGTSRAMKVPWRRLRRRTSEALERFGVALDPDALVADLKPTDRALLALVRAAEETRTHSAGGGNGGGLLVLDEPTVFLPRDGVLRLFALVRGIVASGASVLFVSHDLDEVREVTDRVTVLRNGRVQGTVVTAGATVADLVELIIGRRLADSVRNEERTELAAVAVSVRDLRGRSVRGVTFDCNRGEIVGLTGLPGSGFDEVLYLLFGASTGASGAVVIDGRSHDLAGMTPHRAMDVGIGLLPADRRRDGSVGALSVGDNMMLHVLDQHRVPVGLGRRINMVARGLLRQFDVRPPEPSATIHSLSGGNQQKALLAKWLQVRPRMLLMHEPTQGVDVGARGQIIEFLRAAVNAGTAVVCASSDYEQLTKLCDRVLIMSRGRVTGELAGPAVTKDRITEKVYEDAAQSVDLATPGMG